MPLDSIKPGDQFDQIVLVSRCQIKATKKGGSYADLDIRDKTDQVNCKIWDWPSLRVEAPLPGHFVRITGSVDEYKGDPQVKGVSLSYPEQDSIKLTDFLPASPRDPEEMHRELTSKIQIRIISEPLRAMLLDMVTDEKMKPHLLQSPAAKGNHHAYLGGLLAHILSLWGLAEGVSAHYGAAVLNSDLLFAYVVTHDFAKIKELSVNAGFDYTPIGELVGHVILGVQIVQMYARKHKVPAELSLKLQHGVASHHGEWGDIKPKTIEALAFHHLDNLDAKIEAVRFALTQDTTGLPKVNVPMLRMDVYR